MNMRGGGQHIILKKVTMNERDQHEQRIAYQLVILKRINSFVLEAYQSMIDHRFLKSNLLVHLNPNFKESRQHRHTHMSSKVPHNRKSRHLSLETKNLSKMKKLCLVR